MKITKKTNGIITGLKSKYKPIMVDRYFAQKIKGKNFICRLKCVCGKLFCTTFSDYNNGHTKSCGCLKHKGNRTTHGLKKSMEYRAWQGAKDQCLNKNNAGFKNYGGRGIIVCNRWLESFENFYADMGKRPSNKHSLDRINVNGNYDPINCRWATKKQQANNTRSNVLIQYKGKKLTLKQWSESLNINYHTLHTRLYQKGWAIKQAFLTKVGVNNNVNR